MNAMTNCIKPELLVLIPVLYFLGWGVKKTEVIKDKYIPLLLGGSGIVLAVIWTLATTDIADLQAALMAVFVGMTQGILCAAGSVYFNQVIVKQPKKGE